MSLKDFIENNPGLSQDEIEYYSQPIIAHEKYNSFWLYDYDMINEIQDISKDYKRFIEYVSLYKVRNLFPTPTHKEAVEYAFYMMKPSKDDYIDDYVNPLLWYEMDMNIAYAMYEKAMSNE